MDGKKYRYTVRQSAEGEISGTVNLTKEEACIVAYATTETNWDNVKCDESYTGMFFIDLNNPQEIEEEKENTILTTFTDMQYNYKGKVCNVLHLKYFDENTTALVNEYNETIALVSSAGDTVKVMTDLYTGVYA